MKRTAGFGLALGLLSTIAAPAPKAEAQVQMVPIQMASLSTVFIGCANPGSSQDVAKTPTLKNTTSYAIPKGYVVRWSASDGDKGSLTLAANLAPGATVKAQGLKPGNTYRCNADFQSKPDLVVKSVAKAAGSSVAVQIGNLDPWVGAGQSAVSIDFLACSGGAVLKSVSTTAGALAKSATMSVTLNTTHPGQRFYMRVRADAALQVTEKNEGNNVWQESLNVCLY